MKRLYVVTMCAMRVEADTYGGPVEVAFHVSSHTQGIFVPSEEEAVRAGQKLALGRWPADKGWVHHAVSPLLLTKAFLREALEIVPDDEVDDAAGAGGEGGSLLSG